MTANEVTVAAVDWEAYEREASAAVAAASSPAELDDARVRYLGRKSELAEALRVARLTLVRLPVHGGDCNFGCGQESSSFIGAGRSGPGSEREVRRRGPGSPFRSGAW